MLDATASVGAVGVNDLITAVTAWLGVWGTSFVVPFIEKLDLAISPVASKWLKPIQPVMALVLGATVLPKLVALLHLPADVQWLHALLEAREAKLFGEPGQIANMQDQPQ